MFGRKKAGESQARSPQLFVIRQPKKGRRVWTNRRKKEWIAYHLHSNASNHWASSSYCGFRRAQMAFNRNHSSYAHYAHCFPIKSMYFFFVLENVFLIFIRKMWLLYRKASMMFSTFTERNGTVSYFFSCISLALSLSLPSDSYFYRITCDVRSSAVSFSEIIIECVRSVRKKIRRRNRIKKQMIKEQNDNFYSKWGE